VRETVQQLWHQTSLPMLADASALNWLPEGPCAAHALRVITPHPGEAARMLNTSPGEVQNNRPQALRELSESYGGAYVILKGHQTLIGRGRGELFVNSSGNPHLAQGGTGDLLAGYLAGLMAQPFFLASPDKTLQYGIWQHGASADLLSRQQSNWTVEELAQALGGTATFR
jgi:NAD(P)H-hydrate epimerase